MEDNLVGSPQDVVVVAASSAYGDYLRYSAYICQPGRSFREGTERMAFYADGSIKIEIPRILARRDNQPLTADSARDLASGDANDRCLVSVANVM